MLSRLLLAAFRPRRPVLPAAQRRRTIDPAAGWKAPALSAALDLAGARHSTALVVLYRGKVMAERQWDPATAKIGPRFWFGTSRSVVRIHSPRP